MASDLLAHTRSRLSVVPRHEEQQPCEAGALPSNRAIPCNSQLPRASHGVPQSRKATLAEVRATVENGLTPLLAGLVVRAFGLDGAIPDRNASAKLKEEMLSNPSLAAVMAHALRELAYVKPSSARQAKPPCDPHRHRRGECTGSSGRRFGENSRSTPSLSELPLRLVESD